MGIRVFTLIKLLSIGSRYTFIVLYLLLRGSLGISELDIMIMDRIVAFGICICSFNFSLNMFSNPVVLLSVPGNSSLELLHTWVKRPIV